MLIDKNCLTVVTGGASGLGEGTATMFRAAGAPVVIVDLNAEGETVASAMGASFVQCDVSDATAIETACAQIHETIGLPRVLVNCAGIAPAARTVSRKGPHEAALFQKTVAINLTGTFLMSAQIAALMGELEPGQDGERGVIINTASVAAFDGQTGQAAYAASKAGIAGMTLPMARDLSSMGVRVCTIAPGIFSTPMLSAMPEEVQQSLAEQVPFPKRLGNAEDYASLVREIVSNTMLNGEVIRLDGAIRMGAS